jgi:hypothetical protein
LEERRTFSALPRKKGPLALPGFRAVVDGEPMSLARRFFHTVESEAGWECHQGSATLDRHDSLSDAAAHLAQLGDANAPAELFAHYLDGTVSSLGTVDATGSD